MEKQEGPRPKDRPRHRLRLLMLVFLALVIMVAGRPWWRAGIEPLPLPAAEVTYQSLRSSDAARKRFSRVSPDESGVDHAMPIDVGHPQSYLYSWAPGGGVAVGDLDNDGLPDLVLVNGPRANRMYRQVGDLQFEDVTERSGIGDDDLWGTGVSLVDINNDGRLDIYLCNYDAPNQLFINGGDFRFRERSFEYRLNLSDASMLGNFADYDRDGDLDLFLLTYRFERPEGMPPRSPVIRVNGESRIEEQYAKYYMVTDDEWGFDPAPRADGLLRNNGDGTFTDVSSQAGIGGLGHGLSATWWDFNEDGWPDIYVGNDFTDADQLFRNNRDGTFTNVIGETVPHTAWYSMGADVGDLNQDGHLDLLVADMAGTTHYKQKTSMGDMSQYGLFLRTAMPRQYMRNTLLLNTGTPRMMEAAQLAGLANSDWTWTVKLADLDNDGRDDVFFTNGSARDFANSDIPFHRRHLVGKTNWDLYVGTAERREQNLAFHNRGGMQFTDVSRDWGLDHVGMSMAAAHADLDRDGDLDLVVSNLNEPVAIYRNQVARGNGLLIRLHGSKSNRYGVGARIQVSAHGQQQSKELFPTSGFLSSNEPLVHFGLGSAKSVDKLEIRWPSGIRQVLRDVEANQWVTVVEPESTQAVDAPPENSTFFSRAPDIEHVRHRERPFDDFELQPLLPGKLSQLGPGLSTADVDGDGDADFYLGGGAGQAGTLVEQYAPGHYRPVTVDAFEADLEHEDMGSIWLDVDHDGDLDLLVVSGSYEFPLGSASLADRLYWNDGDLRFRRASDDVLPPRFESGSVAAAADFDRDGDLDVFIGGRLQPGAYPLSGTSRLLRNDNGRFTDVAQRYFKDAGQLGLVTSALWSDVNDDGWADLLVTTEWGPVRCFINNRETFDESTSQLGLSKWKGWWNGITSCDVDADGDLDYVVTNLGLNTKYHASEEAPAMLYYGDFEQKGRMHLVEAEFEKDTLFPVRGKSCSTRAMPHLAHQFPSFHDFASASLDQIYTTERLSEAIQLSATEFRSGVLLRGDSGFEFRPLCWQVQSSPSFGCATFDVDGDRIQDLVLVQNFFEMQPETGRLNGGLGALLRGRGDGQFEFVPPDVSGIVIPEDATSLLVVDVDADGERDLVVGVNDGPPRMFRSTQSKLGKRYALKLESETPNGRCVGARVRAVYDDGFETLLESHLGGGYLAQGPADFEITVPDGRRLLELKIQWPDGHASSHRDLDSEARRWVLRREP